MINMFIVINFWVGPRSMNSSKDNFIQCVLMVFLEQMKRVATVNLHLDTDKKREIHTFTLMSFR